MKYITITIFLFILSNCKAQQVVGYFKTTNGERINTYKNSDNLDLNIGANDSNVYANGDVVLDATKLFYYDASNILQEIKQNEVEVLEYNERFYKNIRFKKKKAKTGRLYEVIIKNDNYILTNRSSAMGHFFYIHSNDLEAIENQINHSFKRKNDYKSLETIVKKYFPNCSGVLEKIKLNIRNSDYKTKSFSGRGTAYWELKNNMFNGFKNHKCN